MFSAAGQNRPRGGQSGQPPAPGAETPAAASSSTTSSFPAPPAVEKIEKTEHSITVNGKTIAYTATAGTLVLPKDDGKPLASIFFVAYTRDDTTDKSKRPVTFTFNGGPGSSSVWLHMGAFGPKRVAMGPDGAQPPPPYHLVDNDDTPLEFTDLVFIDPVTTGFSRNAPGENPAQFHSLEGDLDSVADFIRLYTTKFDRWASPKFLAGESYGTTRSAGLSQVLMGKGIFLNGITLISSVLNFETISFAPGNDLPYILYLPTYTATAWYHKKLSGELQSGSVEKAVQAARQYAENEYTIALMKGDKLTANERSNAAQQVARLTGLSKDYVERSNLRISIQRFAKELLRKEERTVGRYDSRLEGTDIDAVGERPEFDPSYSSVLGAYTALFNDYVRTQLKFESEQPYEILTGKVQPWSYSRQQNQYVNTAEMLREAMQQIPTLNVMVANGYYDMATPFFATEYTMNHLGEDKSLDNRISLTYCEAGHMLYTRKSCLDQLHKDMAEFYQRTLSTGVQATGGR
jgi:carboxypeptidase C (cathepsin A)